MRLFDGVSILSPGARFFQLLDLWPSRASAIQQRSDAGREFLIALIRTIQSILDSSDQGLKEEAAAAFLALRNSAAENRTQYLQMTIALRKTFLGAGLLTEAEVKVPELVSQALGVSSAPA